MLESPISVKAICLIINEKNELLVSEDYDSDKKELFCVPLGGHVRFNERTIDTVKREFKEEINAELTGIRYLTVLENFFSWNGKKYHEINFVYKAELADKELYNKKDIPFLDTKYPNAKIKWISAIDFMQRKYNLYPEKLREMLPEMLN